MESLPTDDTQSIVSKTLKRNEKRTSGDVKIDDLVLLLWIVRLPLLTRHELSRVLMQPTITVYKHINTLIQAGLIEQTGYRETTHRLPKRLYPTQQGLQLLSTACSPTRTVQQIQDNYPVSDRALARAISRPQKHTVLLDIVIRLIEEGRTLGYDVSARLLPWKLSYGEKWTEALEFDGLLFFSFPNRPVTSVCLILDCDNERYVPETVDKTLLRRLCACDASFLGSRRSLPVPLLITRTSRLRYWKTLLQEVGREAFSMIPYGGMTTLDLLQTGLNTPHWEKLSPHTLDSTPRQNVPLISLHSLLTQQIVQPPLHGDALVAPVPLSLSLRPLERKEMSLICESQVHPAKPVRDPQAQSRSQSLFPVRPEDLYNVRRKSVVFLCSQLSLTLTSLDIALLHWLLQHPLLTSQHLSDLCTPYEPLSTFASRVETVRRHLKGLRQLGLVHVDPSLPLSKTSPFPHYCVSEAGVRYLAYRDNIPLDHYLVRTSEGTGWEQHSVVGLRAQLDHTEGVYHCMANVIATARREGGLIIHRWNSARESVRTYPTDTDRPGQIRPDGEILVEQQIGRDSHTHTSSRWQTFLFEYDRATCTAREYDAKFLTYLHYWNATDHCPPPIVMVTQHDAWLHVIRASAFRISPRLPVMVTLEATLYATLLQAFDDG